MTDKDREQSKYRKMDQGNDNCCIITHKITHKSHNIKNPRRPRLLNLWLFDVKCFCGILLTWGLKTLVLLSQRVQSWTFIIRHLSSLSRLISMQLSTVCSLMEVEKKAIHILNDVHVWHLTFKRNTCIRLHNKTNKWMKGKSESHSSENITFFVKIFWVKVKRRLWLLQIQTKIVRCLILDGTHVKR